MGITQGQSEIWLYDVPSASLSRITWRSDEYRGSFDPVLSDDGSTIAFRSDSDFHGEGIADNQWEIWLYTVETGEFTRVTTTLAESRASSRPALNADGTRVCFDSDADFLGEGVAAGQYEIWLYDVTADELTRVTNSPAEDRNCLNAAISGDGSVIAFRSDYDFYDEGILDGQTEIWIYHVGTGVLERATWTFEAGRANLIPSISADGSTIAFYSDVDFLGDGIVDNQFEVWLFKLAVSAFVRLTVSSGEGRTSSLGSTSADGEVVAFGSDSDFHEEGIADDQREIWLWRHTED